MNAREYYDRYRPAIGNYPNETIQLQILGDFQDEFRTLCSQKGEHPKVRQGIVRKLNDKWNDVMALFLTRAHRAVLQPDAFLHSVYKGDAARASAVEIARTSLSDWKRGYNTLPIR